jgi:hypothetical protein
VVLKWCCSRHAVRRADDPKSPIIRAYRISLPNHGFGMFCARFRRELRDDFALGKLIFSYSCSSPMEPALKTVKTLFALSRNECAFPGCPAPIVESESETITGVICHINARSPDGPRYDPAQTDDARNGGVG